MKWSLDPLDACIVGKFRETLQRTREIWTLRKKTSNRKNASCMRLVAHELRKCRIECVSDCDDVNSSVGGFVMPAFGDRGTGDCQLNTECDWAHDIGSCWISRSVHECHAPAFRISLLIFEPLWTGLLLETECSPTWSPRFKSAITF